MPCEFISYFGVSSPHCPIDLLSRCLSKICFTDELSMNPRVRSSPFSPPPADELILSAEDIFSTRRRRLFFFSIHTMALIGIYYCITFQVKLYTVLFGKISTHFENIIICLLWRLCGNPNYLTQNIHTNVFFYTLTKINYLIIFYNSTMNVLIFLKIKTLNFL